jgi:hypothetical protein
LHSLRRTLAVRFSVTVFFALLAIALWAYLGTQRILRSELDRALLAALALERDLLAAHCGIPSHTGATDQESFIATINRFVALRGADGAILAANTPLARDLPLDSESLEQARAGRRAWTTQSMGGSPIRSVYAPSGQHCQAGTVLQVSASLAPLHAANREVVFLMLGTVLLGTVATSIGAAWLAGSSVQPVHEITQQAQAIQAGTVGQRITAHGDVAEFHGLVQVLNGLLERLDRVLASQRRMIADAGHDLRTPLTVMRGELELALRGTRTLDEYRAVLRSLLEEVERLGSISESLVLLARVEAGTLVPHRVRLDIVPLLERAVHRAQGQADGRHIRLRVPQDARPVAEVDERMLTVVMDHLLDNCLRHTPPGTTVDVGVSSTKRCLTIAVDDDGPGVPDEQLPRLFERFYRSDDARTRSAGGGLGLSIAAAIVQAHSGVIRASRSSLGGLRITLELPLAAGPTT